MNAPAFLRPLPGRDRLADRPSVPKMILVALLSLLLLGLANLPADALDPSAPAVSLHEVNPDPGTGIGEK